MAARWLGDWGRFWWALAALNLSKTLFVARRRRSRCPCQSPSDSGLAWKTGCEAMASWNSPARFRRVCPLLKKAPGGSWVCSVNAAEVRPFWGRAAAWFGGAVVALCFVCVVLSFGFLRTVGYPVRFASVAWPPAWHEIREARGRYFFQKAEVALRANRMGEALLSLEQSYQLDPHAYLTGRILAQLWQMSESDQSNQIYRKLMAEHPEQRTQTAMAWHMGLLSRGDFKSVEGLAWERMNADPTQISAWLNAFMIASRRTRDDTFLKKAPTAATLPDFVKQACAWELEARRDPPEQVRRLLTAPIPAGEDPYLLYYRIEWLIGAGYGGDALFQIDHEQDRLPASDCLRFSLDAYSVLGWQSILQHQVGQLLSARSTGTPLLELICAHLIRYPNAALLAQTADAFESGAPIPEDQRLGAYMSLYCAAGAAGDWKRLQAAKTALKGIAGLDTLERYFRASGRNGPIERCLRILPSLPLDVTYALYAYSDSHPPGK